MRLLVEYLSEMTPMSSHEVFLVNDRPGKGIYRCVEQPHWVVSLDDDFEPLPPGFGEARFQNVRYERVVDLSTAIELPEMQEA
jgi:hypothetical protein